MKFIVDKKTVPEDKYQIYIDNSDDTIIAVDRGIDGVGKIENANAKNLNQDTIPEEETVKGVILKLNQQTGKYEIVGGAENEFKIKHLFFASSRISWE